MEIKTASLPAAFANGTRLRFHYTNHKLETEWRDVQVSQVWYGCSEFHTGEQWFLNALCLSRHEIRNFAMRDMTDVSVVP